MRQTSSMHVPNCAETTGDLAPNCAVIRSNCAETQPERGPNCAISAQLGGWHVLSRQRVSSCAADRIYRKVVYLGALVCVGDIVRTEACAGKVACGVMLLGGGSTCRRVGWKPAGGRSSLAARLGASEPPERSGLRSEVTE